MAVIRHVVERFITRVPPEEMEAVQARWDKYKHFLNVGKLAETARAAADKLPPWHAPQPTTRSS